VNPVHADLLTGQGDSIVKTRFLYGAVLAAFLFGAIGCSGGDKTGDTGTTGTTGTTAKAVDIHDPNGYKIGVVASMTGDQKPWGEDCKKGAELAAEEFLQAGGVGDGKGLNIDTQDDASKPEQGKSAAEKLIADGTIALVGEVASGITMQMEQAAEPHGVPVIAVGATKTTLTEGHTNLVRVCYTDAFQGPVMAKFAYDELGLRNVALVTDKKLPYSTGLSDAFRGYFTKLGGKIVDEQFYEQGTTQFQGLLTNLKAKNPDGLFMSGYFPETGPLARQAKEAGLNVKMMAATDGTATTSSNRWRRDRRPILLQSLQQQRRATRGQELPGQVGEEVWRQARNHDGRSRVRRHDANPGCPQESQNQGQNRAARGY